MRQEMGEIESVHIEKKKAYDGVVNKLDQEKGRMDADIKQVFTDYRNDEKKFHQNNI